MRFLVTGAMGYIGSHMCVELRKAYPDCEIIGTDMKYEPEFNHVMDKFVLTNLADNIIYHTDIDAVFHFAAFANVPAGEKNPYEYYHNNINSTMHVMRFVRQAVPYIIHSSTCAVYGTPDYVPVDEKHPLRPESVYASSKVMCEKIVQDMAGDSKYAILRYFNVAGRNRQAGLYEKHDPETHLIPLLMQNREIDIYGTDYNTSDGTAIRDYIHIIDLCQAHIQAFEYLREKNRNLICNLGTGRGCSVREVIDIVESVIEIDIKRNEKPRRQGDLAAIYANTYRMKEWLHFTPKYDMLDIIDSMNEPISEEMRMEDA